MKSKINFHLSAFTLVEALIAMSILIIGIISSFILVTRALYNTSIIQDRLTASFLAQEGLELVREIRDSNYINRINNGTGNWNDGLQPGTYRISFENGNRLETIADPSEATLYFHDDTGLFDYNSSGTLTSFNRQIQIDQISDYELRVTVIVSWQTKGINYSLQGEDHLFDWLPL
jgi:hypothetical protein